MHEVSVDASRRWERKATKFETLLSTGRFSLYHDLIDRFWAGGTDEIKAGSFHRICTLARKMGVKAVVIEDAIGREDANAELDCLESALGGTGEARAQQLTFLSRRMSHKPINPAHVIGQCVIITFPCDGVERSFVFEAILRELSTANGLPLLNNHLALKARFTLAFADQTVEIDGCYFTQQNGQTSVCAHAAVRTVLRHMNGVAPSTADLNRLWDFQGPASRVTPQLLRKALSANGRRVMSYDLSQPEVEAVDKGAPANDGGQWSLICALVESGAPALLAFDAGKRVEHVVPVAGFTLNSDEWHPTAAELYSSAKPGLMSSSLWVDHLVIHDDMLGPYYCMSKNCFGEGNERRAGMRVLPRSAFVVLPGRVQLSSQVAEAIASVNLDTLLDLAKQTKVPRGRWWDTLAKSKRRVLRTTLVDADDYVQHIARKPGAKRGWVEPELLEDLRESLPERFWLCEISLPQLFLGNRAKLGEIIIKTSDFDSENPFASVLGFRFPSVLCYRNEHFMVATPHRGATHVPILRRSEHRNQW